MASCTPQTPRYRAARVLQAHLAGQSQGGCTRRWVGPGESLVAGGISRKGRAVIVDRGRRRPRFRTCPCCCVGTGLQVAGSGSRQSMHIQGSCQNQNSVTVSQCLKCCEQWLGLAYLRALHGVCRVSGSLLRPASAADSVNEVGIGVAGSGSGPRIHLCSALYFRGGYASAALTKRLA